MTRLEDNVRKMLLQRLMAKGIVSKAGLAWLFHHLVSKFSGGDKGLSSWTIKSVMEKIMLDIQPYGFDVRVVRSEADGKLYYCFVNTRDDSCAKASKPGREDWQWELFRAVMGKILASDDGTITFGAAYSIKSENPTLKGRSNGDLQQELSNLMNAGWLITVTGDHLTLGPRTHAELINMLRASDVPDCYLCRRPVVYGEVNTAGQKAHLPCLHKTVETQEDTVTAAALSTAAHAGMLEAGEKEFEKQAVATAAHISGSKRTRAAASGSSSGSGARARAGAGAGVGAGDDDEGDEEEDEVEGSPVGKGRGRGGVAERRTRYSASALLSSASKDDEYPTAGSSGSARKASPVPDEDEGRVPGLNEMAPPLRKRK